MDAFFASVEQRDNPDLKGRPVVVGGAPDRRGVVAAASYEARQYGIHSAMPSKTALQRCPHLIFVSPRFDAYREISHSIREIFHQYTDLVEPLSLDEAYLDVSENKFGLPSATIIARQIKARIFEETELTASAGISINKFLAKTASGVNKPDGLFLIPPHKAEDFAARLAIEKFYGIGRVTAEKMKSLGIFSGADLRKWSETDLIKRFGKIGSFYHNIARGRDDRLVEPNRLRKSVGAEESYAEDLSDRPAMVAALKEIAASVKERLDKNNAAGRTLTLKVKYADYQQVTRSRTLLEPISDLSQLTRLALELLDTASIESKSVRLLGLTISNLDNEPDDAQWIQLMLDLVW